MRCLSGNKIYKGFCTTLQWVGGFYSDNFKWLGPQVGRLCSICAVNSAGGVESGVPVYRTATWVDIGWVSDKNIKSILAKYRSPMTGHAVSK